MQLKQILPEGGETKSKSEVQIYFDALQALKKYALYEFLEYFFDKYGIEFGHLYVEGGFTKGMFQVQYYVIDEMSSPLKNLKEEILLDIKSGINILVEVKRTLPIFGEHFQVGKDRLYLLTITVFDSKGEMTFV